MRLKVLFEKGHVLSPGGEVTFMQQVLAFLGRTRISHVRNSALSLKSGNLADEFKEVVFGANRLVVAVSPAQSLHVPL